MSTLRLRCTIADVPLTLFPNWATSALLGVWLPSHDINLLLGGSLREMKFPEGVLSAPKKGVRDPGTPLHLHVGDTQLTTHTRIVRLFWVEL